MKTNLSSQIKLDRIPKRYYAPDGELELAALTRDEKVYTKIFEGSEDVPSSNGETNPAYLSGSPFPFISAVLYHSGMTEKLQEKQRRIYKPFTNCFPVMSKSARTSPMGESIGSLPAKPPALPRRARPPLQSG